MSSEIIAELAASSGISIKDATDLLLTVLADIKTDNKEVKKKKDTYVEIEYTGKVTFTCITCTKVFNRTFITNIKDQHLHKKAPTCIYCKDMLLNKDKEELVLMIISDRRDCKKIA